MFETRLQPHATRSVFLLRLSGCFLLSLGVVALSLGMGVLGYHHIAGLGWVDSVLNASMILGGMGPVDTLTTDAGKLFASAYALFSGLVFVMLVGLILAPIAHRLLHRFHLDERDLNED